MTSQFHDRHDSKSRRVHDTLNARAKAAAAEPGFVERLLDDARTLWRLMRDPHYRVPLLDKAKVFGALLYFVMPIDLIPDVIFGLGYVDDAVILTLAFGTLKKIIDQYRAWNGQSSPKVWD